MSRGQIADIMTRDVFTVTPETPIAKIAEILEKHGSKRVPVVDNGLVVGIVSRANLVQALASAQRRDIDSSDRALRQSILDAAANTSWAGRRFNVLVHGGKVELWGGRQQALRVIAESVSG